MQKSVMKKAAQNLFKTFREFGVKKVDVILAETFPKNGIGSAIAHRLERASEV